MASGFDKLSPNGLGSWAFLADYNSDMNVIQTSIKTTGTKG